MRISNLHVLELQSITIYMYIGILNYELLNCVNLTISNTQSLTQ